MINYRKEIDGLRAIAVISVIFYHTGLLGFSGGFVGVDVFFVISGYLITSIIISEMEEGTFSLVNFYERRARRILPALFLVTASCIIPAWLWLTPKEMKLFSESLIGVSTFTSNIAFWFQSGYFATTNELKPLIHTWSLAIEEQYYFLFPIFLLIMWKFGKKTTLKTLIAIFLISLTLGIYGGYNIATFSFYNLPTRGWELVIGAFISFYFSFNKKTVLNFLTRQILSVVGMVMILYSIFNFNYETPFPSHYTLIPTLGAALIILFSNEKTIIGKFLSIKPLTSIGLISYSAYLWHQPLLAYFKLGGFFKNELNTKLFIVTLTFLLGFLNWKLIENPFRDPLKVSKKKIFLYSIFFISTFATIGFWGYSSNGFPSNDLKTHEPNSSKLLKTDIILIGDSHAAQLRYGLEKITYGSVSDFSGLCCIPFLNVDRYDYRKQKKYCSKKINLAFDYIKEKNPNAFVVLHSMGPLYLDKTPFKNDLDPRLIGQGIELESDKSIKDPWKIYEIGLRTTLIELEKLKTVKPIFIIDVPELGIKEGCKKNNKTLQIGSFKISDLVNPFPSELCFVPREEYDKRTYKYIKMIKSILSEFPKVLLIDPTNLFCDRYRCKGYDPDYGLLYGDEDHLNKYGSLYFANYFSKIVQSFYKFGSD